MQDGAAQFVDATTATGETPPPPLRQGGRLRWIESLRGIAAVAVVLQHMLPGHLFALLPGLEKYIDPGIFGVTVFFLISGYIIPYSILRWKDHAGRRFLTARFLRLYPAYWVSLMVGALAFHPNTRTLLLNVTMMQRFLGARDVVGPYWSLQVEIVFYVLIEICILCRLIGSKAVYPLLSALFAILAILAALGRYEFDKKIPLALFVGPCFMFASTVYFFHVQFGILGRWKMLGFAAGIYLLISVAALLGYAKDWGYAETPRRFLAMYLAAVVLFFLFSLRNAHARLLEFLGRISYPIYLLHVPIIALVGPANHSVYRYLLSIALILLFSIAVHNLVEKPFMKVGRSLADCGRRSA